MALHDPTGLYEGELSPRADRASRIISILTHAPVLSAFMFPLLNVTCGDVALAVLCTVVTMLTATVMPIAVVHHYSVKYGNTDGDVSRREDRARPLLGGVLCYLLGFALLLLAEAPRISTVMMLSYALSTAVVALISTRWKISIHATGLAGPAVALSYAYFPWGLLVFAVLPPMAWSRYVRRKHTPLQLVGGTVFGIVWTCAILRILL